MSVLIKDMGMPNKCEECPFFDADFGGCGVTNYFIIRKRGKGRSDWCPLVEVPTPHGRLIDADRLTRKEIQPFLYHLPNGDTAIPQIDIEHAPTVIEAEG